MAGVAKEPKYQFHFVFSDTHLNLTRHVQVVATWLGVRF